jgi:hypothetical protein
MTRTGLYRGPAAGALLFMLLAWFPVPVTGQTIRDDVKDFVEENLEGDKGKDKGKKEPTEEEKKKGQQGKGKGTTAVVAKPPDKKGGATAPVKLGEEKPMQGQATGAAQAGTGAVPAPEKKKLDLPKRVIHKKFQLDIKVGGGYRGWAPQQYPTVSVNMASYFTWSVSVKARIFEWLNLHHGYYESNAASNPRTSYNQDAIKVGELATSAAWVVAALGFPILDMLEPMISYESRAFRTKAKPKYGGEVCIVPYSMSGDTVGCDPTTESMSIISSYETIVAGIRYIPSKNPSAVAHTPDKKLPDFFFGGGYLSYLKPYQVTIGTETLSEYLFTGRFYGGGLALGLNYNGGINNVYLRSWAQLGLGQIRLTKDMTLNELAPEDWLIGYIAFNATLGGQIALWKFAPTLIFIPEVTAGGASFFFFKTGVSGGGENADPQTVNWDILWTIRASLVLTL